MVDFKGRASPPTYKNSNIDTIKSPWFQGLFVFWEKNQVFEKQVLKIKFRNVILKMHTPMDFWYAPFMVDSFIILTIYPKGAYHYLII